ncbi:hypothetical protein M8R20_08595 [Pseudomonas sp. R2.Fl]|nr:hypothetical protein [Pseudomonas sp. R2.Fl]
MARKKSSFEKFFSFSRHRKRWGGGKFATALTDYEPLKTRLVEDTDKVWRKGHQEDIADHIANLRVEFAGKPELLFEHAKLIVLIRREYKPKEMYAQFRAMWEAESDFLSQNLTTRWLVSAADTVNDFDEDMTERAIAMITSVLTVTMRLYETERYLTASDKTPPLPERLTALDGHRIELFDNMKLFNVGYDDTLRNMRWRLDKMFEYGIAGKIARATFLNLQELDTVYARFRALHTRDRTTWWES